MREQQSGLVKKGHYARQLPPLPQQQIPATAQAKRHAAYEATNETADTGYTGHQAGLHPDDSPFLSEELPQSRTRRRSEHSNAPATFDAAGDYEIEEDDSYYFTRPHTSARRYNNVPVATRAGQKNVVEHYHDQPLRAHKQPHEQQRQLPPARGRQTEEYEIAQPRHRRLHPLAWIGFFLTLLILGWIGLNALTSWLQGVQNDWTYGKQRHFEINAVVGHGDSANNPSHFTAENNNGEIIVIELPGGNVSKAKIYQIETIPGNGGNPPVKVSFQDMNGDGKPDLLVQIGDGSATLSVVFYNNGSQFVSKL